MIPQEMKRPVFELGKGCLHIKGEDYPKACLEFMSCLKKGNPEVIYCLYKRFDDSIIKY